jgi:glycosyltransferase involved in cell wall biosynthesis
MLISHVIPYFGQAQGGPVRSMRDYAEALARAGHEVVVAGAPIPGDGPDVPFDERLRVERGAHPRFGMIRYCPDLTRRIVACAPDVIHSHGLWTYASLAAGKAAVRLGVPHVLAPCGMLLPGALRRSSLKKRLCGAMFQNRVLRQAACLHAKSEGEAEAIRARLPASRVEIIPNPVPVPDDVNRHITVANDGRPRTVLFLGRLHAVKGVERLVDAWIALANDYPDWRLVMAGPDELGLKAKMQETLRTAGLDESVAFPGQLEGDAKWGALTSAEFFVLPSDFENFGTAAVEAMRCGKPVIATTGTPWKQLPDDDAGWCVPPDSAALAHALRDAMALPPERLEEMGRNAKHIGDRFAPDSVAKQLIQLYESL